MSNPPEGDREKIARIIDPVAFMPHGFHGDSDWHPDDDKLEQSRALSKADDILAALTPVVGSDGASHPARIDRAPREDSAMVERALRDVVAHLAAAISLLENSPKAGAPSNRMFDMMLNDYRFSLAHGRRVLYGPPSDASYTQDGPVEAAPGTSSSLPTTDAVQGAGGERIKVLEEALRPFAAITPSSLYPDDGSENEVYIALLKDPWDNHACFTGGDLARARALLSPTPSRDEVRQSTSEPTTPVAVPATPEAVSALKQIDAMPFYTLPVDPEHISGLVARYNKALTIAAEALAFIDTPPGR